MKIILSYITIAFLVSGCGPTTRLYQTPPLYFTPSHFVPATDSIGQLAASASIMLPANAELTAEYRVHKNFLFNFSCHGSLWGYTGFSNGDVDYRYRTQSFNLGGGIINEIKKSNKKWFVLAGYGKGKTTSVVPEDGSPVNFIYNGNFSKLTLTPGVEINPTKNIKLALSSRQSFIWFKKYLLPDTAYQNKNQFLTDLMIGLTIANKKTAFNFFFGSFLNGTQAGNRLIDSKPEIWRIERFFIGAGFTYKFSLGKFIAGNNH